MSNTILAIDPGPEISGVVLLDLEINIVLKGIELIFGGDIKTYKLLELLRDTSFQGLTPSDVVCEDIVSYGLAVGKTVFDTCKVIGRIQEIVDTSDVYAHKVNMVRRPDVKTVLAGGNTYRNPDTDARKKVDDGAIKRIIKNRFPQTGGGKTPSVGTKKQPGPLHQMSGKHSWQALALAMTFIDIKFNNWTPF